MEGYCSQCGFYEITSAGHNCEFNVATTTNNPYIKESDKEMRLLLKEIDEVEGENGDTVWFRHWLFTEWLPKVRTHLERCDL